MEPKVVALDGDPGRAIIEQAERGGNDLIVMGSPRPTGPIGSLVLGSVSTYVLQHSPLAVLVVHQPPAADEG